MYEYQVAMPMRKSFALDGFFTVVVVVGFFWVVVVVGDVTVVVVVGGATVVVVSPGKVVVVDVVGAVVVVVVLVLEVVVVADGPVTCRITVECHGTLVPAAGDTARTLVQVPFELSGPCA